MDCVSTSQFSFLLEGAPIGKVIPFRGLRQGCPLSPYLFLLCAEGFSGLLKAAEGGGVFSGVQCARRTPKVSHLLFADNSILFCKADVESREVIKGVLDRYEKVSGQRINLQKSAVSFSPNLTEEVRDSIVNCLGLSLSITQDVYLELPSFVGRN